jgi:glycosyltransferase involved in cell wall biosynthesis
MSGADGETCDVLHVLWSGEVGGTERHVAGLVLEAARDGRYTQRACFLAGDGPVGDDLAAHGLADRLRVRNGLDPLGLIRLGRTVRRRRPRVIHLHTRALAVRIVVLLAARRARQVYTEHAPGAVAGERRFLLFYRLFRRTFSRFVAIAPEMARCMEERGFDPERVVLIPHGVTIPPRTDAAREPDDGGGTIGAVCRLEPPKRLDVFLDVIAELRRRGVPCSAIVVGDGSLREALIAATNDRGLDGVVTFAGRQNDVSPWLDRFDVFFMTSDVETFGIAALEAMTRGVPVVAMPSDGGLSSLVERGGMLLQTRDVMEAATAVGGLLASRERRAKIRRKGSSVAQEHRLDRTVAALDKMYGELIAPESRGVERTSGNGRKVVT